MYHPTELKTQKWLQRILRMHQSDAAVGLSSGPLLCQNGSRSRSVALRFEAAEVPSLRQHTFKTLPSLRKLWPEGHEPDHATHRCSLRGGPPFEAGSC